ncbi:MAG: response regulator transcription factor [Solirubrobacteraceae bacterium]
MRSPLVQALQHMDCTRATILLIEDDDPTRTFLADNLTADGYEIIEATTAKDAERLMATKFPDLVVLDTGLPDRDGLDLLSTVRNSDRLVSRVDPDLPVILLSGRGSEVERLRGFARGCDDYVTKPFSYSELHARIGALLRRGERRAGAARIRVGPLEIDALARQAWIDGAPLVLSNKEFGLLRALASEPGRVFTREELLRGVWGYKAMGKTRTLDSHASRLRRKLAAGGAAFVINVWGVGYCLYRDEVVRNEAA